MNSASGRKRNSLKSFRFSTNNGACQRATFLFALAVIHGTKAFLRQGSEEVVDQKGDWWRA